MVIINSKATKNFINQSFIDKIKSKLTANYQVTVELVNGYKEKLQQLIAIYILELEEYSAKQISTHIIKLK